MILSHYAKYLQQHDKELSAHETTALELLHMWLETIIDKNPKSNTEKIIHREIMYAKNPQGDYLIVGKSDSGRKLVKALINFAKSYENHRQAVWLEQTEKSFHKN